MLLDRAGDGNRTEVCELFLAGLGFFIGRKSEWFMFIVSE